MTIYVPDIFINPRRFVQLLTFTIFTVWAGGEKKEERKKVKKEGRKEEWEGEREREKTTWPEDRVEMMDMDGTWLW